MRCSGMAGWLHSFVTLATDGHLLVSFLLQQLYSQGKQPPGLGPRACMDTMRGRTAPASAMNQATTPYSFGPQSSLYSEQTTTVPVHVQYQPEALAAVSWHQLAS